MSSNVLRPSDFDASKISFKAPKILDSGGKIVSIDYDGRQLQTQTASMSLPYGLNVYDKSGPVSYSMDLSFRGVEEGGNVKAFHDMLVAFDERMIEAGIANAQAWFKMPSASREVIKAFYTPCVKVSLDREGKPKPYPPTFKVKLTKKNDAFEAPFYDAQKRPYTDVTVEELLAKGSRCTVLVKCTGLWFAGSKFGATWKASQVKMDQVPERARGAQFLDDDEVPAVPQRKAAAASKFAAGSDDDDDDVVAAVLPPKKTPAAAPAAEEEEDGEEGADEEDDVVEAPPPPPKKTVAKKVVTKTAVRK
jgi:hypothetical protein